MDFVVVLIPLVTGGISCFYGYKAFRWIMLAWGFLLGAILGYAMGGESIIVALIAGIIGAGVSWFGYLLGIYIIGATIGFVIMAGLGLALFGGGFGGMVLSVCGLGVFGGIIGGSFAVAANKLFIVMSTSLIGGLLIVIALMGLTGNAIPTSISLSVVPWWAQIGWIVLFGAGVVIQFGGTKSILAEFETLRTNLKTAKTKHTPADNEKLAEAVEFEFSLEYFKYLANSIYTHPYYGSIAAVAVPIAILLFGGYSSFVLMQGSPVIVNGQTVVRIVRIDPAFAIVASILGIITLFVVLSARRKGYRTYKWLVGISIAWAVLHVIWLLTGVSNLLLTAIAIGLACIVWFDERFKGQYGHGQYAENPPSLGSKLGTLWDKDLDEKEEST